LLRWFQVGWWGRKSRPTADKTSRFSTRLDSVLKRNHEVARRLSRLATRLAIERLVVRLAKRLARWERVFRVSVIPNSFPLVLVATLLGFGEGGEPEKSEEEQEGL
jgi:hypothetical protein